MTLYLEMEREKEEARKEAREEAKTTVLKDLVIDGILTVKEAASRLGISEELFKEKANL